MSDLGSRTDRMNICAFSRVNYWQGTSGGMGVHGKLLSEGLVSRGHSVTMLSTRHPAGVTFEQQNGVNFYYLTDTVFGARRSGWGSESASVFYRLHQQHPFDLVWSQSFDAFGLPRGEAGNGKTPMVTTLHGSIAQEWRTLVSNITKNIKKPVSLLRAATGLFYSYFICQRPILAASDRIICVSTDVMKDLRRWFGTQYLHKCITVENGVDVGFFRPDPEQGRRIRGRYGISENETVILSMGRLTHEKGHHLALEVMPQLMQRTGGIRLIIAGEGDYAQRLQQMSIQMGIKDQVSFPGSVPHTEAVGFYNAADVFVMPTLTVEGLPFVLLEAMACGRAVVASNIGGIGRVILDGQDGLLISPGKVEALSEALIRLIEEIPLRQALSNAARRKVTEQFSLERMITETINVMRSVAFPNKQWKARDL